MTASQTEPISLSEIPNDMFYSPNDKGLIVGSTTTTTSSSSSPGLVEDLPTAVNMVIRQDPFTMMLDANALLAGSLFLVIGMHFVPRLLLESFILAVPIFLLLRNDYQNFLRLGPGGTPPTLAGYARLMWLRWFMLRDPFTPPLPLSSSSSTDTVISQVRPASGILARQDLPYRPGPRPTVAGLAPQRQLNQHGSPPASASLRTVLTRLAARYPDRFGTATSCLEKHGFALFSRHPVNVCGNGEVVHLHNSDHSMHMNLHPDDIAEVLVKGWSQRHPLAWGRSPQQQQEAGRRGWLPMLRVSSPLPETFVLVYAPRGKYSFIYLFILFLF